MFDEIDEFALKRKAMKRFFKFINSVLPVSVGVSIISCLLAGSIGPCGPNGQFGFVYIIGYPIGLIGTLVGIGLSIARTFRYLRRSRRNEI